MRRKHCTITSLSLLQCGYHTKRVLIGLGLDRKVNFVSLFKGRGKLIKLLKVQSETERKSGQVRYLHSVTIS